MGKNIIMFGTEVPKSCNAIPKYRRDELEEAAREEMKETETTSNMSRTRKGGRAERRRQNRLHGRNADTMHYAHELHRDKLAFGRGMWNGIGTDDIRFRKEAEAAKAALEEMSHKEGIWWDIYLGKRIYSAKKYPFFGTKKEAEMRFEKMRTVRKAVFASLLPVEYDSWAEIDNDPYWEEWLDYSQKETEMDSSVKIGDKFNLVPSGWEVVRK